MSYIKYSVLVCTSLSRPLYFSRGRWHGDVMVHTRKASQREEFEEFRKEVRISGDCCVEIGIKLSVTAIVREFD